MRSGLRFRTLWTPNLCSRRCESVDVRTSTFPLMILIFYTETTTDNDVWGALMALKTRPTPPKNAPRRYQKSIFFVVSGGLLGRSWVLGHSGGPRDAPDTERVIWEPHFTLVLYPFELHVGPILHVLEARRNTAPKSYPGVKGCRVPQFFSSDPPKPT